MKDFISKLLSFFFNKNVAGAIDTDKFYEHTFKVGTEIDSYLKKNDVVFFKEINAYGVFKYDVIKEMMMSSDFSISPMHVELNHIYFQQDPNRHQHNKKVAIKKLAFLSKELQYTDSQFTTALFDKLIKNCPNNKEFSFIDYVINPLVFISALKNLGFIKLLSQFDFESPNFNVDVALAEIKTLFEKKVHLDEILKRMLDNGMVPEIMQGLLDEASVEEPFKNEDLPNFFSSMIFANVESVSSFMSSYIYFVFRHYPQLLSNNDWKKLEELANEILRIYVPTPLLFRSAHKDVAFRGENFIKGDLVAVFLSAANLDPSVFEDPYKIKLGRTVKNLSFGRGKISCIGQFASFRITLNVLKNILPYQRKLEFLEEEPSISNIGSLRINKLKAILHD